MGASEAKRDLWRRLRAVISAWRALLGELSVEIAFVCGSILSGTDVKVSRASMAAGVEVRVFRL